MEQESRPVEKSIEEEEVEYERALGIAKHGLRQAVLKLRDEFDWSMHDVLGEVVRTLTEE